VSLDTFYTQSHTADRSRNTPARAQGRRVRCGDTFPATTPYDKSGRSKRSKQFNCVVSNGSKGPAGCDPWRSDSSLKTKERHQCSRARRPIDRVSLFPSGKSTCGSRLSSRTDASAAPPPATALRRAPQATATTPRLGKPLFSVLSVECEATRARRPCPVFLSAGLLQNEGPRWRSRAGAFPAGENAWAGESRQDIASERQRKTHLDWAGMSWLTLLPISYQRL
jgi:hypothetical protein